MHAQTHNSTWSRQKKKKKNPHSLVSQTPHFHNQLDIRNNKNKKKNMFESSETRKDARNLWSGRKGESIERVKKWIRRAHRMMNRRRQTGFWRKMRRAKTELAAMREKTASSPLVSASSINVEYSPFDWIMTTDFGALVQVFSLARAPMKGKWGTKRKIGRKQIW